MAKMTDDIKKRILSDWSVGISQNQLAKKYSVSPATINKLCKGIEQTNINLVNTKVAVIRELQTKSEYEVNSIESEVNIKVRRSGIVFGGLENALKLANEMIINNKTVEKINVGEGVQNFEPRELNAVDIKNVVSALIDGGKSFGLIETQSAVKIENSLTNAQTNNNITVEIE